MHAYMSTLSHYSQDIHIIPLPAKLRKNIRHHILDQIGRRLYISLTCQLIAKNDHKQIAATDRRASRQSCSLYSLSANFPSKIQVQNRLFYLISCCFIFVLKSPKNQHFFPFYFYHVLSLFMQSGTEMVLFWYCLKLCFP